MMRLLLVGKMHHHSMPAMIKQASMLWLTSARVEFLFMILVLLHSFHVCGAIPNKAILRNINVGLILKERLLKLQIRKGNQKRLTNRLLVRTSPSFGATRLSICTGVILCGTLPANKMIYRDLGTM